MVEQRKQARGWSGRYVGYRVNCESVPALPAVVVRWMLEDARKIPYLLVWQSPRTGEVQEAVRIARYVPPYSSPPADWVEVKRTDHNLQALKIVRRSLPRNGGYDLLLICTYCHTPRRYLYGWEADKFVCKVRRLAWQCRSCAELRYASEGSALWIRSRSVWWRLLEQEFGPDRSERPEPWYPYVFSNPYQAAD